MKILEKSDINAAFIRYLLDRLAYTEAKLDFITDIIMVNPDIKTVHEKSVEDTSLMSKYLQEARFRIETELENFEK